MTAHALPLRRRLPQGRHARSVVLLAGCVSLVMALLVTAVTAAVGLGGLARLGGLLGASPLDYARGPLGEYFPLTDSFVQDELGATFGQSVPAVVPVPLGSQGALSAPSTDRAAGGVGSVPLPDDTSADLRNDDFSSAYAVRGLPFSSKTSQPSERQPDEPTSCTSSGGTRWFRYVPRFDVDLLATTSGSGLGTAIGVFTGSSLDTLRPAACASDAGGDTRLSFAVRADTAYWFQVSKTVSGGVLVFNLTVRSRTILASTSSDDRAVGAGGGRPQISANGRYVVFSSTTDLVPGTQNGCVSTKHPSVDPQVVFAPGPCSNIYRRDLSTNTTILVSTRDGEVGGDDDSSQSSISADGRFIAFRSWATNLVQDDTNGTNDVFLRDTVLQQTQRISVTSAGGQTTDPELPFYTAISGDGRFVGFSSAAPELAPSAPGQACEADNCMLAFLRDVRTGRTHLVSVDEDGDLYYGCLIAGISGDGSRVAFAINYPSFGAARQIVVSDWRVPGRSEIATVADNGEDANDRARTIAALALSKDGRYLVFESDATNLVDEDTNGELDIFVRDLLRRRTVRVSVASDGSQSERLSERPSAELVGDTPLASGTSTSAISADGRFVTFGSEAPNLVPGDTNETYDVFVHDLLRRTTTRVSLLDDGQQSKGISFAGTTSQGGGRISFLSRGFRPEDDGANFVVYVRQQPLT